MKTQKISYDGLQKLQDIPSTNYATKLRKIHVQISPTLCGKELMEFANKSIVWEELLPLTPLQ